LAEEKGTELAYVGLDGDHRLDLDAYDALLRREPKLVAVTHVSNALGPVSRGRLRCALLSLSVLQTGLRAGDGTESDVST
jgi:hypothetical protein